MEELLEVAKKQLKFQKIISTLLAVIIVLLLVGGVTIGSQMKQMSTAMSDAVEKLQEIDLDGINEAISGTQEMLKSVDEFSEAMDELTERVQEFDTWMSGIFGR